MKTLHGMTKDELIKHINNRKEQLKNKDFSKYGKFGVTFKKAREYGIAALEKEVKEFFQDVA